MTTQNINEFLLELSGTMQEYLSDLMNNMFTIIYPNMSAYGHFEKYGEFKVLLKEFFDTKESSDFEILLNLILLVLVGDVNNKKIDIIYFYTSDKKFMGNYKAILKDRNKICNDTSNECVLKSIRFYSMKDKLEDNVNQ